MIMEAENKFFLSANKQVIFVASYDKSSNIYKVLCLDKHPIIGQITPSDLSKYSEIKVEIIKLHYDVPTVSMSKLKAGDKFKFHIDGAFIFHVISADNNYLTYMDAKNLLDVTDDNSGTSYTILHNSQRIVYKV